MSDGDGLVEVFTTEHAAEALVVASLLDSAGIEAEIDPPVISASAGRQTFLDDQYVVRGNRFTVRVKPDQADDARAFIEGSQDSSEEKE